MHPGLLTSLKSRCFFTPTKSNLMKSCNAQAGDESKLGRGQDQQTAGTEDRCVPNGGACTSVSSAHLRSDSAVQPAGTERKWGSGGVARQILHQGVCL